MGFRANVLYAAYLVQYKEMNGNVTFDYSRTEIKFDSKWDRKLFKNTYTITSEMAITERSDKMTKIPNTQVSAPDITLDKSPISRRRLLGEYNVIEPNRVLNKVIATYYKTIKEKGPGR
jgi:hypothetical protein